MTEVDMKLLARVAQDVGSAGVVVDFGCGAGDLLALLTGCYRCGVDICPPEDAAPYVLKGDMLNAGMGGDVALVIDVIEHVEKGAGGDFLRGLLCRFKKVIVFTPLGMWPQEGTPENPYQAHLSGWELDDFSPTFWSTEVVTDIGDAPESIYAVGRGM